MLYSFLITVCLKIHLMLLGTYQTIKEQILDRPRFPSIPSSRRGKTILITGGSRGIGLEAVKQFLSLDCQIIIGCRNTKKGKKMFNMEEMKRIQILPLDLGNHPSIRQFVKDVTALKIKIDVLINNAGIFNETGPRITTGSYESHFATNYLGPFMLTHLLLPQLDQQDDHPARIVNVSSVAISLANTWMDLDDLQLEKVYDPTLAYAMSKAEQVMFAQHLNSRLRGLADIRVIALHPGIVCTDLSLGGQPPMIRKLAQYTMKTPSEGANTLVHAAMDPAVDDIDLRGFYFENCAPAGIGKTLASTYNQEKLWSQTCSMLEIENFGNLSL